MSCIHKPYRQPLTNIHPVVIITGNKVFQNPLCIIHIIQRRHFRFTGTSRLTISPLCFKFLNMCRIFEHNPTELTSGLRGKHLPPEPMVIQKRQKTGMVDMCVRHKHIIDHCRIHRNLLIHIQIRSLLHSTIHQQMLFPERHIVTASGYLPVSPQKL